MDKKVRANLMLLMITVFWGASYILTKIGLETLETFNLISLRFIIAFLVGAAVFRKDILNTDIKTLRYSLVLSLVLFGVFISMTLGLKYTSVSSAGFLISLSVVLVPIISFIFLKERLRKKVIISIIFALIGITLLTLNENLSINRGDILCIVCAILFAVHIVLTGEFVKKVNSVTLSVLQLGLVGIFSSIFSLFTESFKLPNTPLSWIVVLGLSILCTALGYIVQGAAQKYISPTHTGLILSLEPVFSALFAYIFLGEFLTLKGYIGAIILLLSVLIAALDLDEKGRI
ncbi:DMT family transporter [Clostridium hydrogeniformans]|uniref:DMT family transporter n=1 Tax=Clostridium hydrogeniformans TaxID=349933 RepID=UPI00047F5952|nr:DMT family transporter [Clostridium hydrogeniformans]